MHRLFFRSNYRHKYRMCRRGARSTAGTWHQRRCSCWSRWWRPLPGPPTWSGSTASRVPPPTKPPRRCCKSSGSASTERNGGLRLLTRGTKPWETWTSDEEASWFQPQLNVYFFDLAPFFSGRLYYFLQEWQRQSILMLMSISLSLMILDDRVYSPFVRVAKHK